MERTGMLDVKGFGVSKWLRSSERFAAVSRMTHFVVDVDACIVVASLAGL